MLFLLQVRDAIPAAAVRDTVAAIIRQSAYQRSLRASLAQRVWSWFLDLLGRLQEALLELPHVRTLTIAGVILLALLVVLRVAYASRLREDGARRARAGRARRAAEVDPAAEARRLAGSGAYAEAAHALYRASLQQIARRERLRLHPSKTSGDYARELRTRRSALHDPFRRFGRHYDRLLFGHGAVTAEGYARLLADAEPLLAREHAS